ncbi:MAG: DUF423 domain-containing protein [Verrucomicrobiales bacterium]
MRLAALLAFLGVSLGAFGAHALKETLTESGHLEAWKTAVLYQMVHAVAMLALAIADRPAFRVPYGLFAAGIALFSGSIYGLCLTDLKFLGPITPIGGVLFLVGWAWVAVKAPSARRTSDGESPRA